MRLHGEQIKVIPLSDAKAGEVADVLRDLYGGSEPTIFFSADERGNQLLVRGPGSQIQVVELLIPRLEESARESALAAAVPSPNG